MADEEPEQLLLEEEEHTDASSSYSRHGGKFSH